MKLVLNNDEVHYMVEADSHQSTISNIGSFNININISDPFTKGRCSCVID